MSWEQGEDWQGDIKEGEVNFVLPEEVAPYSIVKEGPSVSGNTYPYKISGKTITVSFTNYEPLSDAVILYAVFDSAIVKKIEDLKKMRQYFPILLEIAALYRKLAQGVHCEFCVDKAADLAIDYYIVALDKAVSKTELDAALNSSVYGDYGEGVKVSDLLGHMRFKDCADADYECISNVYHDRGGPLGGGVYLDSEILNNYALKARKYDSSIHNQVVAFSQK